MEVSLSSETHVEKILVGNVTVEKWIPGHVDTFSEEFVKNPPDLPPGPVIDVADRVIVPADMPAGLYSLSIGIIDEGTSEPVVQLGIEGRTQDGWYPLSEIRITE